jgi:tetratricopeptide (TPR) repeat protein
VSEESERVGSGPEGNGAGVDPTAVALALAGASRERADSFLTKQEALIAAQLHHLHEQLNQIHLDVWEKRLGVLLRLATAFIGLVLAAGLAVLLWGAAHADGLVVEGFSVPPDFAAKGMSGQVVATEMLDNLSALLAVSTSVRAPNSYANNWGDDLKVEIPETGISAGEAYRFLKKWLGHETQISGEVIQRAGEITVVVRAGSAAGKRFSGAESDFDRLLQQAAEAVYADTQPYLYHIYLLRRGRIGEAQKFLEDAARSMPASERKWAYAGQTSPFLDEHHTAEACAMAQAAIAIDPDFGWGWREMQLCAGSADRRETRLTAARAVLRLLTQSTSSEIHPEAMQYYRQLAVVDVGRMLGDYTDAIRQIRIQNPLIEGSSDPMQQIRDRLSHPGQNMASVANELYQHAATLIDDHDTVSARKFLPEAPGYAAAVKAVSITLHDVRADANATASAQAFEAVDLNLALATEDWARVTRLADMVDAQEAGLNAAYAAIFQLDPLASIWPARAYALAMRGDFKGAHTWIDRTPGDCDLCLRMRGRIDAAERNYDGAAFWFARLEAMEPSIPFADNDWGRALLERGKPDAAIEKFAASYRRGPHFADPLEGWGEALMAKNQSHLALAKFTEAGKYAPNWGRLHLKWGEALTYAGRKDEARAQFARAAELDLTPGEKSELARHP